jgi:hypothetical protein
MQALANLGPEERNQLLLNVQAMLADVDQAIHRSCDPPDARVQVVTYVRTGRRGRPRVEISREWLATALELRGPKGIAASLPIKVSARTVRNNALRLALATPGRPLFTQEALDDGSFTRIWRSRSQDFSPISDTDLDALVFEILQSFPNYGRSMLIAELLRRGHTVQRRRVREAYVRVHGAPRPWGRRNIPRRPYAVAGPNSLWHHDGQHGGLRQGVLI